MQYITIELRLQVCSFSWQKLWIVEWGVKGSVPWGTSCPMSRENKGGSSQETIPSCAWLNKILATFLAHSVDKSFGLQSGSLRVQSLEGLVFHCPGKTKEGHHLLWKRSGSLRVQSLEGLVFQCPGKTKEGHHKRLYLHACGSIKSWPHSTGGSPFSTVKRSSY